MNAGVSTSPCGVDITPRRAAPSVCVSVKRNEEGTGNGRASVYDEHADGSDETALKTPLTLSAWFVIVVLSATLCGAPVTGAAALSSIYQQILSARFDQARAQLANACPPAPAEACRVLEVVALWWEIQLDPNNETRDSRLQQTAAAAIAAAEQWTQREPGRAEAWFYLAAARAPLVQWRVLRGQRLAAARDGGTIKTALEHALALDPSLHDAHFGIGLYLYYADVVPAPLKALRWVLLMPGGDRTKGLQEILVARDRGELLADEADYQLHFLYLWYEHEPARALELLMRLDARHPSNPLFIRRIAEVQDEYFHDHAASAAAWRTLIDRAAARQVERAPLGVAQLGLAREYEHLHDRTRAIAAYTIAISSASDDDRDHVRAHARDALQRLQKFRD